jgi:hypothetical protein
VETDLILLQALEDVTAELEARLPGYLRRQPLRMGPDDPLAARCLAVATSVGLALELAAEERERNAVDRYVGQRLTAAVQRRALGDLPRRIVQAPRPPRRARHPLRT